MQDKGVHKFHERFSRKVNVIAQLDIELAYNDAGVQHFIAQSAGAVEYTGCFSAEG